MLTHAASFFSTIPLRDRSKDSWLTDRNGAFVLQGDEVHPLNPLPVKLHCIFYPIIMRLSPGQLFSHCVVWTGDKSGRVCARGVCLRCHGKCPQTDSPQQVEHKHTQQHRLGGEKAEEERRWTPTNTNRQRPARNAVKRGVEVNAHSPQSKLSRIHLAVSQRWAAQCALPEATYGKHTIIAAMLYGGNC